MHSIDTAGEQYAILNIIGILTTYDQEKKRKENTSQYGSRPQYSIFGDTKQQNVD